MSTYAFIVRVKNICQNFFTTFKLHLIYRQDTMIEIRSDMYGRFDDELYGLATKVVGR